MRLVHERAIGRNEFVERPRQRRLRASSDQGNAVRQHRRTGSRRDIAKRIPVLRLNVRVRHIPQRHVAFLAGQFEVQLRRIGGVRLHVAVQASQPCVACLHVRLPQNHRPENGPHRTGRQRIPNNDAVMPLFFKQLVPVLRRRLARHRQGAGIVHDDFRGQKRAVPGVAGARSVRGGFSRPGRFVRIKQPLPGRPLERHAVSAPPDACLRILPFGPNPVVGVLSAHIYPGDIHVRMAGLEQILIGAQHFLAVGRIDQYADALVFGRAPGQRPGTPCRRNKERQTPKTAKRL